MMGNLSFTLISFFYISLLTVVYFFKPRIKSDETKLYSYLVSTCMIGVCISIGTYYFMVNLDKYPLLNEIFSKAYLVFVLLFTFIMTLYVLYLVFSKDKKFEKNYEDYKFVGINISVILFVISLIIIIFLKIDYFRDNKIVYSYGDAVNFIYMITRVLLFSWIILLLFKFKNIKFKKSIPMIAYVILGIIVSMIQGTHPELLLTTSMLVFVTFLMYFTIENPDVKMIKMLNEAKEQAERANSAKSDFLSSMSHEIRTPLNAIVGFSNNLIEEDEIKEQAKDDVKNIIMASSSLLDLVNGILDISKIEAGKLEIIDTYYDFEKMFEELVLFTKARIQEKPLDFRYMYDKTIPKYLYGDVSRVKQVILNLLTNAVKYTNNGYIDFKINSVVNDNTCKLIITVEDSGIGIKKEDLDKLFMKFERLGIEKKSNIEGTGLGLSITKKLVEMMGGKITVHSVYGKGSIFTILLDQRIASGEELEKLIKENDNKEVEKVVNFDNKKVLVVDDNNLNLKVAQRLLEKYGLDVECIESGFQCIEKIASGDIYDLILLDDMMPKLSGSETLVKLKNINSFKTPVIALTANAITGMKEEYLKKGFDDYLSKPIEKGELNRVLKKFLKS